MQPADFISYVKDLPEDTLVDAWSVQHKAVWDVIQSGEYTASVTRIGPNWRNAAQWMGSQMSRRGLTLASGAAPIWLILGHDIIAKKDLNWGKDGIGLHSNLLKLRMPKRDLLISWYYPYANELLPGFDAPLSTDPNISAPYVRAFAEEHSGPFPLRKEREKTWLRVFDLDLIDDPRFTRWGHCIAESSSVEPESRRLRLQAVTTRLRREHVIGTPQDDW